jgi:hypothetical protein
MDPAWGAVDRSPFPVHAQPSLEHLRSATLSRVPVVALAEPDLGQGRLLAARSDPQQHSVTLAYGDDAATTLIWGQAWLTHGAALTRQALADERDRLFHQSGIDEPEPADMHTENLRVALENTARWARIRHEASLWSAEVWLPIEDRPVGARPRDRAVALVVSRGVPVPDVALRLENDLQPLWDDGDAWSRRLISESTTAREAEPLPARDDLTGLEELIGSAVAGGAVGPHRERPLAPRKSRHNLRREWEAALATQIRYGNQAPAEASRSIMMLVSQLRELSTSVRWWDDAGAAAIAESIRYTVFDSEVPSRPAQLLWRTAVDERGARAEWLKEWERWHVERAG